MMNSSIAMTTFSKPLSPSSRKNSGTEETKENLLTPPTESLFAAPAEKIPNDKKNILKNSKVWVKETGWNKDTDKSNLFSAREQQLRIEDFDAYEPNNHPKTIIKVRSHRINGKDDKTRETAYEAVLEKIQKKGWKTSNFEGIKNAEFLDSSQGKKIFMELLKIYSYLNQIGCELALSHNPPTDDNNVKIYPFVCKVTLTLLEDDPIVCELGHSNERSRIKTRIENGNYECPHHGHELKEKNIAKYRQARGLSYKLRLSDIHYLSKHPHSRLPHEVHHVAHETHGLMAHLESAGEQWNHFWKKHSNDIKNILWFSAPAFNEVCSVVLSAAPVIGAISSGTMGGIHVYSAFQKHSKLNSGLDIFQGVLYGISSASLLAPPPANFLVPAVIAIANTAINLGRFFYRPIKDINIHLENINQIETILGVKNIKSLSMAEIQNAKEQTLALLNNKTVKNFLEQELKLNLESFIQLVNGAIDFAINVLKLEITETKVPEIEKLNTINPYLNVDVDSFDADGYTLLHKAIIDFNKKAVATLVIRGADVNIPAQNEQGYTPLQEAVVRNNLVAAEYLLRRGATKEFDESAFNTPLYLAFFHKHKDMVDLLIKEKTTLDRSTYHHCNMFLSRSTIEVEKAIFHAINEYALKIAADKMKKQKHVRVTDPGFIKINPIETTQEAQRAHATASLSSHRSSAMATSGISSNDGKRWSETLEFQLNSHK